MLSLRLQRAQRELQAHRSWLNAFTAHSAALRTTRFGPSTSRTFSDGHACREQKQKQEKKQWIGKPRTEWQKRQKLKQGRKQHIGLETLSRREQLLQAVKDYDINQVIDLYSGLPEKKPLTPGDLTAIAQCVHQRLRLETYKTAKTRAREDTEKIIAFAEELVKDIKKERLLPSPYAHVHLLGTFKEAGASDAGIRFWEWLKAQDEEYINADVYAVAIDILARNGNAIEETEQLYQDALARFPGTFFAYHLSPEAILEDRERDFALKGIPMNLLLNITIARLIGGHSHRAYLALDTAFRLYPAAVPVRFFATFKDERPASEFFTVFAMACRAGIQLPLAYFKVLIMRLRKSSHLKSMPDHMSTIRAMLAATRLHIGAGGTMPQNTVSELIIAVTQIFCMPGVRNLETKDRKKMVDETLANIKKVLEISARYGAVPGEAVFNSIIKNIGGYGGFRSAIGIALADMKVLGMEPSELTGRSMVIAAGLLADADLVKKGWQVIIESRKKDQTHPDGFEFSLFVKAARLADIEDFAREQFELLKEHISEQSHPGIEAQFAKPMEDHSLSEDQAIATSLEVSEAIDSLRDGVASLDMATKDRPKVHDFSGQSLPMALLSPPEWLQVPDDDMRKIYDELTTEQIPNASLTEASGEGDAASQNSSDKQSTSAIADALLEPPVSITNISYGDLRFQNWKSINYLLWLSAKHDNEHNAAIDAAIAAAVTPPQRQMGIAEHELPQVGPYPLDNFQKGFRKGSHVQHARLHQARNEIYQLRGRDRT